MWDSFVKDVQKVLPKSDAPAPLRDDSSCSFVLTGLPPERASTLAAAKALYLSAGGTLDEYADAFVGRFLYRHGWVLERECEEALRATAKWRSEAGADAIRAKNREALIPIAGMPNGRGLLRGMAMLPQVHLTFEGDIVTYTQPAAATGSESSAEEEESEEEESEESIDLWTLERNLLWQDRLSMERGHLVRFVMVQDWDAATFDMAVIEKSIAKKQRQAEKQKQGDELGDQVEMSPEVLLDRHYPTFMKAVVAVNVPVVGELLWPVVRGFLPKDMQRRLQVHSKGDASSKALLSMAAAADVPRFFGGARDRAPAATLQLMGDAAAVVSLLPARAHKYAAWLGLPGGGGGGGNSS
jgi:hypothetical protein